MSYTEQLQLNMTLYDPSLSHINTCICHYYVCYVKIIPSGIAHCLESVGLENDFPRDRYQEIKHHLSTILSTTHYATFVFASDWGNK